MRATEIIRGLLDLIDGVMADQPQEDVEGTAYSDRDIKRFKQIVDLAAGPEQKQYSTQPQEEYASVEAVTQDAGADQWQGTKEPEDIRGTTFRIYPSKDRP